jgi:hypothetical protein
MRKPFFLFLFLSCASLCGRAQTDFDAYRQSLRQGFNNFRQQTQQDYQAFRAQTQSDYVEFVRQAWAELEAFKGDTLPFKHLPVPPVIFDGRTQPKLKPIDASPIVIAPSPTPSPVAPPRPKPVAPVAPVQPVQPQPTVPEEPVTPVQPVQPVPPVTPVQPQPTTPVKPAPQQWAFTFFGTEMAVRQLQTGPNLGSRVTASTVADAWKRLAGGDGDAFVQDCLQLRDRYDLCDWAYILMLDSLTTRAYPRDKNNATLLMAYAFASSGYKMRMATTGSRLYMLFASQHTIFEQSYFTLDGDRFYTYACHEAKLQICTAGFSREQPLSLKIASLPHFAESPSPARKLTAKNVQGFTVISSVDRNQLRFFDTYPTSTVGSDMMSRWALYAHTPLSDRATQTLYPQLRALLKDKTTVASVQALLSFVQTAFVYEYDDKVWGGDRAFFADETLYYPYCDCEDRSILLTHLVRDLLGLRCALIYYPGHLAAAIEFPADQQPSGDAISLNGQRFVICDPTYIGAPIGLTMPGMDNSTAKAVIL